MLTTKCLIATTRTTTRATTRATIRAAIRAAIRTAIRTIIRRLTAILLQKGVTITQIAKTHRKPIFYADFRHFGKMHL